MIIFDILIGVIYALCNQSKMTDNANNNLILVIIGHLSWKELIHTCRGRVYLIDLYHTCLGGQGQVTSDMGGHPCSKEKYSWNNNPEPIMAATLYRACLGYLHNAHKRQIAQTVCSLFMVPSLIKIFCIEVGQFYPFLSKIYCIFGCYVLSKYSYEVK